jgi:hypothetical protein
LFWIGTCQIIFKLQNEKQKLLERITEIITKRKRKAERVKKQNNNGIDNSSRSFRTNRSFQLYPETLKPLYKFKY